MSYAKVRENKSGSGMESARFYISYMDMKVKESKKEKSCKIISALTGEGDILIELKSSLLGVYPNRREQIALDFLKDIKELGLSYRSRRVPSSDSGSIFTRLFLFGGKKTEAYEIIVHVPAGIWEKQEFKSILPEYGVMYYIGSKTGENGKLLEDIFNGQIMGDELLDVFECVIYDCSNFGQMGIFTGKLTINDINDRLGDCGK
jgi:hypothetical protein